VQVEILAEGDHVNELMVVVSGLVEVAKPSEWLGKTSEEESIRLDSNSKSIHGGRGGIELGSRCDPVLLPIAAAPIKLLALVRSSGGAHCVQRTMLQHAMTFRASHRAVSTPAASSDSLKHSHHRRIMGNGDTFGEIAFFTEIPQIESVHSLTVAKVLTIPRTTYQDITASFPINARVVLENLNDYVEAVRPKHPVPVCIAEDARRKRSS